MLRLLCLTQQLHKYLVQIGQSDLSHDKIFVSPNNLVFNNFAYLLFRRRNCVISTFLTLSPALLIFRSHRASNACQSSSDRIKRREEKKLCTQMCYDAFCNEKYRYTNGTRHIGRGRKRGREEEKEKETRRINQTNLISIYGNTILREDNAWKKRTMRSEVLQLMYFPSRFIFHASPRKLIQFVKLAVTREYRDE